MARLPAGEAARGVELASPQVGRRAGNRPFIIAQRDCQDIGQRMGRIGGEQKDSVVRLPFREEESCRRGAGGLADAAFAAEEEEAQAALTP
jgi:hypothetical protein